MTEPSDDYLNNLVAAGALWAVLSLAQPPSKSGVTVEIVVDDDSQATNQLEIKFPFLLSPYRVTIERVADVAEQSA